MGSAAREAVICVRVGSVRLPGAVGEGHTCLSTSILFSPACELRIPSMSLRRAVWVVGAVATDARGMISCSSALCSLQADWTEGKLPQ